MANHSYLGEPYNSVSMTNSAHEENFQEIARPPRYRYLKQKDHPSILRKYCFNPGALHKNRFFKEKKAGATGALK